MKIEMFVPPVVKKSVLNIDELKSKTRKEFKYITKGRYAITHIIDSFGIQDAILLPIYVCRSVLEAVQICGLKCYFYDIDEGDLNADLDSIKNLYDITKAQYLFVASMYGNPANLIEIEKFCNEVGLILIDDAAQSFGAILEDRYIGTFGHAGFFSFSPGKPTAGHLGAFYWTDGEEKFLSKKNNYLFHKLIYWNFFFNRLHIYKYKKFRIFCILHWFVIAVFKYANLSNDKINKFEKPFLGGVLRNIFSTEVNFRKKYFSQFIELFKNNSYFTPICPKRGMAMPHKIVLKANTSRIASCLIKYLNDCSIYCNNGYMPLIDNLENLPHMRNVDKRIIEIPIENDKDKMMYLFDILNQFTIR